MSRYNIVINHYQVSADLTNFPVYINLNDIVGGITVAQANSTRVYKADGITELPREIVSTNEMHFRADTLSSSIDTFFILDIDGVRSDYAANATYGAQNVWSNGYVGVWHLDDLHDSTIHGNDGTDNGGTTLSTGKLGGARSFDGSNYIICGNNSSLQSSTMTISAWCNIPNPGSSWRGIVVKRSTWSIFAFNGYVTSYDWVASGNKGGSTPVDSNWQLYSGVFQDGVANGTTLSQGAVNTDSFSYNFQNQSESVYIGGSSPGIQGIIGDIDEVRISNVARSSAWTATEYTNQSNPGLFYSTHTFNSRDGYAYVYENVGYNAPNSGEGYGYSYENVGYNAPNSGEGYGYSYENITLYVIGNNDMLPPIIS